MDKININLDFNNRPDYFLLNPAKETSETKKPTTAQRVTTTLLPLLSLHSKTGAIAHLGAAAYQAYNLTDKPLKESAPQFVYLASTTALAFVAPRLKAIVTITTHVVHLGQHAWNKDWTNAQTDALQITHQVVYVASLFYATPALLALSLSMQACYELYQARQFIKDGLYWEAASYTIVGAVRGYQAIPHAQTAYWDQFGSELDQSTWNEISEKEIRHRSSKELLDVKALLTKHGIQSHQIQNIKFDEAELDYLLFKNMRLEGCDFDDTEIWGCVFDNVQMINCEGGDSTWIYSNFTNSTISECKFKEASIESTSFNKCLIEYNFFVKTYLQDVEFNNTTIDDSSFEKTHFNGIAFNSSTIFCADFIESKLENISFYDSKITNSSDFYKCSFKNSSFASTTIKKSRFEKTSWENIHFSPDSTFYKSDLKDAQFSNVTGLLFHNCKNTQTVWIGTIETLPTMVKIEKFHDGFIGTYREDTKIKLSDALIVSQEVVVNTLMNMAKAAKESRDALESLLFSVRHFAPVNDSRITLSLNDREKEILKKHMLIDANGQIDEVTMMIIWLYSCKMIDTAPTEKKVIS
ncbi:MAG: pentapeptide repeat-containing protein [Verrucomicrobia bacterium]|nr:pentapeptide repeat-containing protein [Verrucomicrobiota bacterium]